MCSNQYLLEIKNLEHVFLKFNGCPTWVVRWIAQKVVMECSQIQSSETIDTNNEQSKHIC